MKKIFTLIGAVLTCALLFAGCGPKDDSHKEENETKKVSITVTTFPLYDWARTIAPDAEITLLMDNGVDLHNYQPSASDILRIVGSDLFIYVGGESDKWVKGVLDQAKGSSLIPVNLLETIGDKALEEEITEGMEHEHEDGDSEEEIDEHLWLSLSNAKTCCLEITKEMKVIDPDHADSYQQNVTAYVQKMDELDQKFKDVVKEVTNPILLFGDRFPFRYFSEEYGISHYAAFAGCSAETEASFETISFLANKVRELSLRHVCVIEGSNGKIAGTIIKESGMDADVITFYSMQAVSGEAVQNESYLSFMEKNLEALTRALN